VSNIVIMFEVTSKAKYCSEERLLAQDGLGLLGTQRLRPFGSFLNGVHQRCPDLTFLQLMDAVNRGTTRRANLVLKHSGVLTGLQDGFG
jgi:hypothetical protein